MEFRRMVTLKLESRSEAAAADIFAATTLFTNLLKMHHRIAPTIDGNSDKNNWNIRTMVEYKNTCHN